MTKSNQQTFLQYTFNGPALLFDVTAITPNEAGAPITFSLTGNDAREVLTDYEHPRPVSGGFFFGFFDNLIERRSCKLEGDFIGDDPTAYSSFLLTDHVMALEGQALFNDDPLVRAALRFPVTSPTSGLYQQNRIQTVSTRSLLVVRLDRNKKIRRFIEAHYYPVCGIRPADEPLSAKEFEPLDFYALVGQSTDDDGCLTTKFDTFWFTAIDSDGVNTLLP